MLSTADIKTLRELYPAGTRIRLLKMDDIQAPPAGTEGTVTFIDDAGTIHMRWNTGSSLGLIAEENEFEVLK